MLRSSPASAMQKTYDDCYLICSTAVYFEKQNNEDEALRSWRSALDNIYYFNAYKMSPNYRPKNETERALQDSLVTMERQCKERVDLLETLKVSREEPEDDSAHSTSSSSKFRTPSSSSIPTAHTNGSRHDLPPPYPSSHRPQMPMRPQSRTAPSPPPRSSGDSSATTPALSVPSTKTSRTPSPDKKGGMLKSTLRPGVRDNSRQNGSRLNKTMRTPKPNAVGKAATLAWPAAPASALSTDGLPASLATSSAQLPPPPNLRPTPPAQTSSSHRPKTQPTSPYLSRSARAPRSDPFAGFESSNEYASTRTPPTKSRQSRPLPTPLSANGVGGGARPAPLGPPPPPIRLPSDTAQDQHPQPNGLPTSVPQSLEPLTDFPSYRKEFLQPQRMETKKAQSLAAQMSANYTNGTDTSAMRRGLPTTPSAKRVPPPIPRKAVPEASATSSGSEAERAKPRRRREEPPEALTEDLSTPTEQQTSRASNWEVRVQHLMKNLPGGVDEQAAKAIFNEIVIKGDEVHWDDVAGLEIAKTALKEAVVYPFLRPDLFMGLREPARGMLLFGPPGTGKTMLARAVATESRSTFFAISASSLTSKFLGESEKLVRALFSIAKALAPSIIFVDEIDSLLSARGGSSEHEATRRIKTEFLIQWSDLAKAAAGRESADKTEGDATRVLVLAATNLPWAIDEAARRRFVRRQYIPLPEDYVRESQLRRLMSAQNYRMSDKDFARLVKLTDGFSGSDVTALAKDAAMGPLRSLGEKLLHMAPEDIRPISVEDFETSLTNIRPSVSKQGLKEFEDWAKEFGERGG